ncbi:hypothetical protein chiPu_0021065 [Chiloscyllium punctatum]|uniref:Uncharacterized protein n=1 Tax=Chiloscyllium punctatum TaxID=137246 RepID=A0A401RMP1_CHIPU|nr:hypothetical protein [Chiloscyllium punctatum]
MRFAPKVNGGAAAGTGNKYQGNEAKHSAWVASHETAWRLGGLSIPGSVHGLRGPELHESWDVPKFMWLLQEPAATRKFIRRFLDELFKKLSFKK